MTPTEFGYWLRGITDRTVEQFSVDSLASLVLQKAAEILDRVPAKAEPPKMTSLTVGQFCVHNINTREQCPACANFAQPTWRVFAVRLPVGTSAVYIQRHDRTTGNQDDAPAIPIEERAASAGGEVASGITGRG